jgi:hypothetical protein
VRTLHKSWQDKRPGFTKRVRWYEPGYEGQSIRLNFYDAMYGETNMFYTRQEAATEHYDAFKDGKITVQRLLEIKTEGWKENERAAKLDMVAAHSEGWHDDMPREGCPECER